jgi:Galactose-3-O-sulfotransferase
VYPGPGDGDPPRSVLTVDHLVERFRARRNEIRVVTGHFPLCTAELLDAPFVTLTLLREPVERTLSQLRHYRESTPEAAATPLEQIYEDPVRFELVHNHMVKMFALEADEMTDGVMTPMVYTKERLDQAKARLATVDAVGLQERFNEFCAEVGRRFAWELGGPIFMNRTRPVEVSQSFRRRIATDNVLDAELYEFARQLWDARRTETT